MGTHGSVGNVVPLLLQTYLFRLLSPQCCEIDKAITFLLVMKLVLHKLSVCDKQVCFMYGTGSVCILFFVCPSPFTIILYIVSHFCCATGTTAVLCITDGGQRMMAHMGPS